jgi:hypothetical protein
MNASGRQAAWSWFRRRRRKARRSSLGFALHEAERRPGIPASAASAQARFEHEARMALREWLML